MPKSDLFKTLGKLTSERRNPRTMKIDSRDIGGILQLINREDRSVPGAVAREIPAITRAVRLIVASFRDGGRLIYVGAGTSGRLGILDATECPPTFGTEPSMVQGLIAGGRKAVFASIEGADDRTGAGAAAIRAKKVSPRDVVCGIAASARTPFVVGALLEAKRRGARTIYVTTNPRKVINKPPFSSFSKKLNVVICADVGPEVVMGSTRMKAGTAQKLILNMMTTASMIRLGKVYGNMMVDLQLKSRKLEERARRVLMIATGADYAAASRYLAKADGHVKSALVMMKRKVTLAEAKRMLSESNGMVGRALKVRRAGGSR